jgi:hypothetical protein
MKKRTIFFGVLIVCILGFLIIGACEIFQPRFELFPSKGLTEVGPKVNVLVIDQPNQTQEQLFEHIQNGQAVLLLWLNKDNGLMQAYTFNTLESLVRLEKNKLGFLDAEDAELAHLYVAKYDPKKQVLYYSSLRSKNISLIEANRTYLIGEILSDSKNFEHPAGKVIYTDKTVKELRMAKMLESQISDATLQIAFNNEKKNEVN